MDRSDITELYYITQISNVSSILKRGILSHNLSLKVPHQSIAMPEMQAKRKNKKIPGAGKLHDYANLYFDAHNPMLCKRRDHNNEMCILRIKGSIIDLPNVIIADRNAASNYVGFYPVTKGLTVLDKDKVYARYWTNPNDQIDQFKRGSIKCAEVLVPEKVETKYILGTFVANQTALESFNKLKSGLPVEIKSDIFF